MEKLIKKLMEKHQLQQDEAEGAVHLVVDYLKSQNPHLKQLIDHVMQETGSDGGDTGE
ncbi:MAG TPA: hypothetical protein VFZ78_02885 [Flavisolibacter sp.]